MNIYIINSGQVKAYEAQGYKVKKYEEIYRIDRNNDKIQDIMHKEVYFPELKVKDSQGRDVTIPEHKKIVVMIDDDFDGVPDRIVFDEKNIRGEWGADGKFEKEVLIPKRN